MSGPLQGVRVVELAGIGPGPFAAMLLAELGADVVRIDRPAGVRMAAAPSIDLLRRQRPAITIDLKTTDGVEQVLRLVDVADVVVEGNRPGVAERLGLGPEDCWKRNPRVVYGRITGWGQDGPLAHTAGHDINYLALSGALHPMGPRADGGPTIPLNLLGDFGGGSLYLVIGILAALWEARSSGRGQVVDAAIVDGAAHLTTLLHGMYAAGAWTSHRGANLLDGGTPWYNIYRTKDGEWMAVGAIEPQFFAELCTLLDIDAGESDRADRSRWMWLQEQISTAFAAQSQAHWTEVFARSDACVAPVLSPIDAPQHPHLCARQTFVEVDGLRQPAPAPRFSRTATGLTDDGTTTDFAAVLAAWCCDDTT